MTDKANLAETWHWAEREDILFHLSGKAFTHLHNISFCLVFIALWKQNDGIRMLKRNLILEESHIIMITLETMTKDK